MTRRVEGDGEIVRPATTADIRRAEERIAMRMEWVQQNQTTLTEGDISTIESLSDAAMRSGDTQTAIAGYALALRLRSETGIHPQRRSTDA